MSRRKSLGRGGCVLGFSAAFGGKDMPPFTWIVRRVASRDRLDPRTTGAGTARPRRMPFFCLWRRLPSLLFRRLPTCGGVGGKTYVLQSQASRAYPPPRRLAVGETADTAVCATLKTDGRRTEKEKDCLAAPGNYVATAQDCGIGDGRLAVPPILSEAHSPHHAEDNRYQDARSRPRERVHAAAPIEGGGQSNRQTGGRSF